jgi:hypothetical protein
MDMALFKPVTYEYYVFHVNRYEVLRLLRDELPRYRGMKLLSPEAGVRMLRKPSATALGEFVDIWVQQDGPTRVRVTVSSRYKGGLFGEPGANHQNFHAACITLINGLGHIPGATQALYGP